MGKSISSSLMQRILTAILLLPIVIAAILQMPSVWVEILSGIFFSLAAWEWISLPQAQMPKAKKWLFMFSSLTLALVLRLTAFGATLILTLCGLSMVWWMIGLLGILCFPKGKNFWKSTWLLWVVGYIVFISAWLIFNKIHGYWHQGPIWVLLMCAFVWAADIGAYFVGRCCGRHKLAVEVSPGKTWEGALGALLMGELVMMGFVFYYGLEARYSLLWFTALMFLIVAAGVIGDLVESLFKRVYAVKDSGTLLPGHGGVLDRLDSMLAVLPIFYLGLHQLANLRIIDC